MHTLSSPDPHIYVASSNTSTSTHINIDTHSQNDHRETGSHSDIQPEHDKFIIHSRYDHEMTSLIQTEERILEAPPYHNTKSTVKNIVTIKWSRSPFGMTVGLILCVCTINGLIITLMTQLKGTNQGWWDEVRASSVWSPTPPVQTMVVIGLSERGAEAWVEHLALPVASPKNWLIQWIPTCLSKRLKAQSQYLYF
jgi:hypothetical protein